MPGLDQVRRTWPSGIENSDGARSDKAVHATIEDRRPQPAEGAPLGHPGAVHAAWQFPRAFITAIVIPLAM